MSLKTTIEQHKKLVIGAGLAVIALGGFYLYERHRSAAEAAAAAGTPSTDTSNSAGTDDYNYGYGDTSGMSTDDGDQGDPISGTLGITVTSAPPTSTLVSPPAEKDPSGTTTTTTTTHKKDSRVGSGYNAAGTGTFTGSQSGAKYDFIGNDGNGTARAALKQGKTIYYQETPGHAVKITSANIDKIKQGTPLYAVA